MENKVAWVDTKACSGFKIDLSALSRQVWLKKETGLIVIRNGLET